MAEQAGLMPRASAKTAGPSAAGASPQAHEALEQRARMRPVRDHEALLARRSATAPQPRQPAAGRHGLPDGLKARAEALSGISLDGVKVHHDSPEPARLGAQAFAQGADIHLGPGQERHLPHEAWHVVQQAPGRVAQTRQMKSGVPLNDDAGLEREADAIGNRLAAGRLGAEIAAPLPRLRPSVARGVVQRGGGPSKSDESAALQVEYQKHVANALVLLKGKLEFGASPQAAFDERYWKKVVDPTYKFAITTIVKPSIALKALMDAGGGIWSMDCAEYVQVCNLYATMMTFGAKEIDSKPLTLRQHGSTPFEGGGVTFQRDAKGSAFSVIVARSGNQYMDSSVDEPTILRHVPAGSRVCFKNPVAPDTPFRNENAVALGDGNFSAHPMGSGLTGEQIVAELVKYNKKTGLGGESGGADQIFVSQIEILAGIPLGKATKEALGLTALEAYFQEKGIDIFI
jgi:hypothetical protein